MHPRPAVLLATLLVAALGVGCKHHRGATCDAAGGRFLELARADLAASQNLDPANRRALTGLLAPMRDAMVRACREDGWSVEARACMVTATDKTQFSACDAKLTEPQRELLRKAASDGSNPAP